MSSSEPSIRWKTRVHVLGEDPDAKSIRGLREEVRRSPRVRALLSRRDQLGRAGTARQVYYKWQGLHWVLASLADLGYPEGDEGLYPLRDRVVGFWLGPGYFREYTARTEAEAYRGRGVPLMRGRYRRCASQQGNALYSVVTLGIADDRAHSLAERLLHWQWPDGGWNCDRHPEADTSSFMETLLPMLGLGAYARRYRRPAAAKAARAAADVFLRRRLFKRVSDGRVIASDFVALHYPRYWHYDYLAGLIAIAKIGMIRDARCTEALDLLEEHRLPDGGWPAEKRYYKVSPKAMVSNADYVDWGGTARRRMNEWVTVDALAVLRAAGRFPA
ncbi:MAG: hypothetical protein E6J13_10670 [Chloroflexi bacterium]|nr:MAG: hypothetical protein E6J13_10670 [Chloroflexota bacterium]